MLKKINSCTGCAFKKLESDWAGYGGGIFYYYVCKKTGDNLPYTLETPKTCPFLKGVYNNGTKAKIKKEKAGGEKSKNTFRRN